VIDPSRIPSVDVMEADALLRDAPDGQRSAAVLLDVREPGEFFMLRAPGAALLPISQFIARHGELPKDRTLLVICATGNRSTQATAYLLANGWPDVRNVTGGMRAWQMAGLDVKRGPVGPHEGELPGRPAGAER
jgi:rhodanese-related sulfurtransferase